MEQLYIIIQSKMLARKTFLWKFWGGLLLSLSAYGAPTLVKGPDSSYANFLNPDSGSEVTGMWGPELQAFEDRVHFLVDSIEGQTEEDE